MADINHLKMLKKGVNNWNNWRRTNENVNPDLSNTSLKNLDLGGFNLADSNLMHSGLSKTNLSGTKLSNANLQGANLTSANLEDSNLLKANLNHALLLGADLTEAVLVWAKLHFADLSEAVMTAADLYGAECHNAKFIGTKFYDANCCEVNLSNADLTNSEMGSTILGSVDLSSVIGLETVKHDAISYLDVHSIYCSGGALPESFLRGVGFPDDFIGYIKSLTIKSLKYYSCFISYSSKDQPFVEKLYSDLQSEGVRCWYAPEDLKIGDKFRQIIDNSIKLRDKLLLVLSENSVTSEWVEKEVETAFEEEQKRKRTVLFPISIDSAVMDTEEAWASDIRRSRHIGSFVAWRDGQIYKESFERLLKDLREYTISDLIV